MVFQSVQFLLHLVELPAQRLPLLFFLRNGIRRSFSCCLLQMRCDLLQSRQFLTLRLQ